MAVLLFVLLLTIIGSAYVFCSKRKVTWQALLASLALAVAAAAVAPFWGNPGWSMTGFEWEFWISAAVYTGVFILGHKLLLRHHWRRSIREGIFQGLWVFLVTNYWG